MQRSWASNSCPTCNRTCNRTARNTAERGGLSATPEIANVLVSGIIQDPARHRANHVDALENW